MKTCFRSIDMIHSCGYTFHKIYLDMQNLRIHHLHAVMYVEQKDFKYTIALVNSTYKRLC